MVVLKWSLKKHTGCFEQFTRIVRTNLHPVVSTDDVQMHLSYGSLRLQIKTLQQWFEDNAL